MVWLHKTVWNMKALGLQLGWPPLAGITLNDFLMFCTCARAMGTVLSIGLHEGASDGILCRRLRRSPVLMMVSIPLHELVACS
jgi:hypothetical protein